MPVAPFSALIDDQTQTLLNLSPRVPMIVWLARDCGLGEHLFDVQTPNYMQEFPLARASYDTYPNWTWNTTHRRFTPAMKPPKTELRQRSLLAVKKGHAFCEFSRIIATARYNQASGLLLQEEVYAAKLQEARDWRAAPKGDYPFIKQYAELAGLSVNVAAQEILLKAKMATDELAKTEYFRLKYMRRLRQASLAEIDPLRVAFREEFYRYYP